MRKRKKKTCASTHHTVSSQCTSTMAYARDRDTWKTSAELKSGHRVHCQVRCHLEDGLDPMAFTICLKLLEVSEERFYISLLSLMLKLRMHDWNTACRKVSTVISVGAAETCSHHFSQKFTLHPPVFFLNFENCRGNASLSPPHVGQTDAHGLQLSCEFVLSFPEGLCGTRVTHVVS